MDLPLYKVEHIIKEGEFRYLRNWFSNPDSKASLYISDLGRFELNLAVITRRIKQDIIPRLRANPSEENIEEFRSLWKMRKKILNFILDKRQKSRHD